MARKSNSPVVEYRSSAVHQSRQYYGPTEQPAPPQSAAYSQAPPSDRHGAYEPSPHQGQQAPGGYSQPPGSGYQSREAYFPQDHNWQPGAEFAVAPDSRGGRPLTQNAQAPRQPPQGQYLPQNPAYPHPESRNSPYYPAPATTQVQAQYTPQQPGDQYYRGSYKLPFPQMLESFLTI